MQLELVADPSAIVALSGLKGLAAYRNGRPRTQPIKIVWHDSPEQTLLAEGLILAEQKGIRRVERVVPGAETWLPAQPAPAVVLAPPPAVLPAPLAPLAAFEGRQTVSEHRFGTHLVTVTLAKGVLRTVAAEQPAARIWLSGDDHAVHAAALLIAGSGSVAVPLRSLSAEAIALATGQPATDRHRGAPVLPSQLLARGPMTGGALTGEALPNAPPDSGRTDRSLPDQAPEDPAPHGELAKVPSRPALLHPTLVHDQASSGVPAALMHILGHLIDVILANAPAAKAHDERGIEAVHQMRVAVRRARSALSIFRPALPDGGLAPITQHLKALGASLGPTRDWDVFVSETLAVVMPAMSEEPRLERLLAAAERRRRDCRRVLVGYLDSADFRMLGIELAWFAAASFWRWPVASQAACQVTTDDCPPTRPDAATDAGAAEPFARPDIALPEFAARVLRRRWKKLLSTGKRIEDLDIAALHGLRLQAKRTRYAAEMFAAFYPGKASRRFIRRLSILQERLGTLNDAAVAGKLLAELGGPVGRHAYATGIVMGFLAARAADIRPRIVRASEKFRRQPAYWT